MFPDDLDSSEYIVHESIRLIDEKRKIFVNALSSLAVQASNTRAFMCVVEALCVCTSQEFESPKQCFSIKRIHFLSVVRLHFCNLEIMRLR